MKKRNPKERNFMELLRKKFSKGKFVCVGLDSELGKIPKSVYAYVTRGKKVLVSIRTTIVAFNKAIVDATADLACAYKPNSAFYEKEGVEGLLALRDTVAYIRKVAPDVPVIYDAKRGDIGDTNTGYAASASDYLGADAITVHPYLGGPDALKPFLDQKDKGVIVLCRTSNKGAGEFQDQIVIVNGACQIPLYQYVAKQVTEEWNKNGNCMLVAGATYPDEIREIRNIAGDIPLLIPGIGAQGGNLEQTVLAAMDSCGGGFIINSSRGIIYASNGRNFAKAARDATLKLHHEINNIRSKKEVI